MQQSKTKTGDLLGKISVGTVHRQFKKCGKPNCKCARGERHLSFYYFVRVDGKLKARYLRKSEVAEVRLACFVRRQDQKTMQTMARMSWKQFREVREELRELFNLSNQSSEAYDNET